MPLLQTSVNKHYRVGKSGLVEKFSERHIPFVAFIELTDRCNLKCLHCMRSKSEPADLKKATFEKLITNLADLGTLNIVLSGGEAMMHPDFFDFLTFAKERKFKIKVSTNGTLITRKMAALLKPLVPITFQISLYGMRAAKHEAITQTKGAFRKTMKAIQFLKEAGVSVCVHMPVLRENFSELKNIRDFAKKNGLEFSCDFILSPGDDGSLGPLRYRITDVQLKMVFDQKWVRTEEFCTPALLQAKPEEKRDLATYSCRISTTGQVFPSGTIRYEIGNLNDQSFSDIWSGPHAKKLRSLRDSDFECAQCHLFGRCARDIGLAYAEHGQITAIPKEWCRFAKYER